MALRYLHVGYRLSILAVIASAPPVGAQERHEEESPLIRVTTDVPQRMAVGTLVAWNREILVLQVLQPDQLRGSKLTLRPDRIERLEVSRGSHSRAGWSALRGGAIGFAAGAVVGAIVGPQWADAPEPSWLTGAAYLGGIGLAAGAGVGALIGALTTVHDWEEVPLDELPISLTTERGPGLAFRISVGGGPRTMKGRRVGLH